MAETVYASDAGNLTGHYKVTYLVNKTQEKLTRGFESEYHARQFVNKLRHSKRCTLVSFPIFS